MALVQKKNQKSHPKKLSAEQEQSEIEKTDSKEKADESEEVPHIKSSKKWWNKTLKNWEQRLSLYISLLLTAVATALAVMTYNQTTKIEGMQDLLSTFKARVKLLPGIMKYNNETLEFSGVMVNFGPRTAYEIYPEIWVITDSSNKRTIGNFKTALAPSERENFHPFHINRHSAYEAYIDDDELIFLSVVLKIKFVDEVTGKQDSVTSFYRPYQMNTKEKTISFQTMNIRETEEAKMVVRKLEEIRSKLSQ